MPLAGRQLSLYEALALCFVCGWKWRPLAVAVAVMTAESGRYVEAWHDNDNGSVDRGLFQINSIHEAQISSTDALKAVPNAAYAFKLWESQGWKPWAVFNHGTYLLYLPAVLIAKARYRKWHDLVATIADELA